MKASDEAECICCSEPVANCNCGETETWSDSDGPMCPYCGCLNKAIDSCGRLFDESTDDYSCDHCSQKFYVSVEVTFSWSAVRRETDQ